NERWAIKSERIAMIRDDQPAQRRAAAAGRAAPPQAAVSAETMRACAARIDQSMSSGRDAGRVDRRGSSRCAHF
ncbi:hypothetical protein, partial [Nocardia sp. 852002-20019_SCH5090214]|uniref:hypothetical protein n=1 Tax=Nocardia sp. 852002-20019_SCH5090214 TaxID=1834087 RepID=UPI001E5BDB06